jgi:hypothetical protein
MIGLVVAFPVLLLIGVLLVARLERGLPRFGDTPDNPTSDESAGLPAEGAPQVKS